MNWFYKGLISIIALSSIGCSSVEKQETHSKENFKSYFYVNNKVLNEEEYEKYNKEKKLQEKENLEKKIEKTEKINKEKTKKEKPIKETQKSKKYVYKIGDITKIIISNKDPKLKFTELEKLLTVKYRHSKSYFTREEAEFYVERGGTYQLFKELQLTVYTKNTTDGEMLTELLSRVQNANQLNEYLIGYNNLVKKFTKKTFKNLKGSKFKKAMWHKTGVPLWSHLGKAMRLDIKPDYVEKVYSKIKELKKLHKNFKLPEDDYVMDYNKHSSLFVKVFNFAARVRENDSLEYFSSYYDLDIQVPKGKDRNYLMLELLKLNPNNISDAYNFEYHGGRVFTSLEKIKSADHAQKKNHEFFMKLNEYSQIFPEFQPKHLIYLARENISIEYIQSRMGDINIYKKEIEKIENIK